MRTKHILWVFSLVFIWACGGLNKNDLRAYVENKDNGLIQEVNYPNANYHIMYRPNDLAYIYAIQGNKPEKRKLEAFIKERENTSLFIMDVSLSQDIKSKVTDYTEIRETYQNALNANFSSLVDGEETAPCLIYHCETVGKGDYRINLLFGKGITNIKNDWTIRFFDPVTGNNPAFNFGKENLLKTPSLKI